MDTSDTSSENMSFNDALRTIDAYAEHLNARDAKALLEPLISLGMSQAHLAREVGVSETLVSLWLSGRRSLTVPQATRVLSFVISASALSTHPDVQASIRASIHNWLEVLRQRRSMFYHLCAVLAGGMNTHYTRAAEGAELASPLRTDLANTAAKLGDSSLQIERLEALIALAKKYDFLVEQARLAHQAQTAAGQPFSSAVSVEGEKITIKTGDDDMEISV